MEKFADKRNMNESENAMVLRVVSCHLFNSCSRTQQSQSTGPFAIYVCANELNARTVAVWTVWCLELNKSQRKGFSSLSFIHPQSILIVHIQGERARKCLDVLKGKEIGCYADEEIENVILLVYLMSSSMLSESHFFFGGESFSWNCMSTHVTWKFV